MNAELAFQALIGEPMLPWQRRLLKRFTQPQPLDAGGEGPVPDALDLPTGLGKTAVIALWLIARAMGAPIGRRLVYIVDRRVVVDQATTLADRFARLIEQPTGHDGTDDERAALDELGTALGIGEGRTLAVSTLRGQHADNRLWLLEPAGPAIIVGTVDMLGSRLLFSGYGVSPRTRPMHAALLARDSLVVLDESHLVPPFEHLLSDLSRFVRAEPMLIQAPPMRLLRLSATGRTTLEDRLQVDEKDRAHPWIRGRLVAPKRLSLDDTTRKSLANELAARAFALADEGARVVIFCDRFDDVSKVIVTLGKLWKSTPGGKKSSPPIARLTGQTRVLEREKLMSDDVFRRFVDRSDGDGPAFLVATSAGEVGIDYDARHMVCDLVAWERMVQRLGRANRSGSSEPTLVDVLAVTDDDRPWPKAHAARWRRPFESGSWKIDAEGRRDASLSALMELAGDEEFARICRDASSEEPYRPPFERALVSSWAMTSARQHSARPAVDPWLRGWHEESPEATIVWRRWLPSSAQADDYLREAPVHLLETLAAPLDTVRVWLVKVVRRIAQAIRADRYEGDLIRSIAADVKGEPEAVFALLLSANGVRVLTWSELKNEVESPVPHRRPPGPGDTLIVDARFGGLTPFGNLDPASHDQPSVWDMPVPERDTDTDADTSTDTEVSQQTDPRSMPFQPIPYVLRRGPLTRRPLDGYVRSAYRDVPEPEADVPTGRWIERLARSSPGASAGREQTLEEHHDWVREQAVRHCEMLGIDGDLRAAMEIAARWHDAGKDRKQWQRAMGAEADAPPLAKTKGDAAPALLAGYRHEFGSVRDLLGSNDLSALNDDVKDLALHLIASHHGHARPGIFAFDPGALPPIDRTARPPTESDAEAVALRFSRLQRRHGHYGLAWLETVFRVADWTASRQLEEGTHDGD